MFFYEFRRPNHLEIISKSTKTLITIKIKIVSTNKVVPKMTVRRHVNIGTIDSGQNICPIYIIRWDSSFVMLQLVRISKIIRNFAVENRENGLHLDKERALCTRFAPSLQSKRL